MATDETRDSDLVDDPSTEEAGKNPEDRPGLDGIPGGVPGGDPRSPHANEGNNDRVSEAGGAPGEGRTGTGLGSTDS